MEDEKIREEFKEASSQLMLYLGALVQEALKLAGAKEGEVQIAVVLKLPSKSILVTVSPEWGSSFTTDLMEAEQRLGSFTGPDKSHMAGDPLPHAN